MTSNQELKAKVEEALKEIRCFLQMEGGDCELIEVSDDTAKIRLTGSCAGCPFAQLTLKMRVEKIIKDRVPEIKEVVNVEE
ncbi:MAG: NifU family protein [Candidatus Omnitrophica bacterium]|nr:NifU family protein [Candidatus Omnitrophota bacterium]